MKKGLEIIPIGSVDELLKHALVAPLVPIEWTDPPEKAAIVPPKADGDRPGLTH